MSSLLYLASDQPLEEVKNPHEAHLEIIIDTRTHRINDGGLEDAFAILSLHPATDDIYTEKKHRASLEWFTYTRDRAGRVIDYIRRHLAHTDEIELWHVWLGCEDRPRIRTCTIPIDELVPEDLEELDGLKVGTAPLTHYRFVITRARGG